MRKALGRAPIILLAAAACSKDPGEPATHLAVRIVRFEAAPERIQPDETATLSWETEGTDGVRIEPAVGLAPPEGEAEVRPFETTTYTLTVGSAAGDLTRQVTVEVDSGRPEVTSFTASPQTIQRGQSSELEWTTFNATHVIIEPTGGMRPAQGKLTVTPEATTEYRITAAGDLATDTSSLRIVVVAGPDPMEVSVESFTAEPSSVMLGDSVTLRWTTKNADGVTIDYGVGAHAANGEVTITPSSDTTYTLVANGPEGSDTAQASVRVTPQPMTSGETCGDAVMVPSAGGTFQSTTEGLANDYQPPEQCTGYEVSGPDRVYAIQLAAGDVLEATASFDADLDGALYVLTACTDLANSCVAGSDEEFEGGDEYARYIAAADGVAYVVVGAEAADSEGPHELEIKRWTGETCDSAPELIPDGLEEPFTTAGKTNDYSPTASGCTGRVAAGPDRVYTISVEAGEQLEIAVNPDTGYDPSVYLVEACTDIDAACVAASDAPARNRNESIAILSKEPASWYVIVDGAQETEGTGTITATIARGDTCVDAYTIPAGGGTFESLTTGYADDYGADNGAASCTGAPQRGPDAAFKVSIPAGARLQASLTATWNAALYLVTSCATSATSCVNGEDRQIPGPDRVDYSNTGSRARTYYLIVDSRAAAEAGEYSLNVTITP